MTPIDFDPAAYTELDQESHRALCIPLMQEGCEIETRRWRAILFSSRGIFDLGNPTTVRCFSSRLLCSWLTDFAPGRIRLEKMLVVMSQMIVCNDALYPCERTITADEAIRLDWTVYLENEVNYRIDRFIKILNARSK